MGTCKVRSAVYNESGSEIIMLLNRKDEGLDKPHIYIAKSGRLDDVKSIGDMKSLNISFPQEIKRNEF